MVPLDENIKNIYAFANIMHEIYSEKLKDEVIHTIPRLFLNGQELFPSGKLRWRKYIVIVTMVKWDMLLRMF